MNQDRLQEVTSHILNHTGPVSVLNQRGADETHFRELVEEVAEQSADITTVIEQQSPGYEP